MKRFILPLYAILFLIVSCAKDDRIDLRSGVEYLTIKEMPAMQTDYIDCEIDGDGYIITLNSYVADGTPVVLTFRANGVVYYDGKIIVSGQTEVAFQKSAVLSVKSPDGNQVSYRFEVPDKSGEKDDSNRITGFALQVERKGILSEHAGTINDEKGTITVVVPGTGWIDNIRNAPASFLSTGAYVTAGGQTQISGITENNYMSEVVYTVIAENGDRRDYTVKVVSPQSTGLPVVRIDTEGGAGITDKENYVPSTISIHDGANPSYNITEAPAGVRGRGNTTWNYDKKPYRIKFEKKTSVFGLEKAKSWVLLANWQDPTYMMSTVAFELSRRLGLAFTPTPTHVELFLNGSYKGSYVLCEQIQVNPGRVEIDEFKDVLLELDSYFDEEYKFESEQIRMPVNIKSPEFDGVSAGDRDAFIETIKADYNRMEKSVLSLSDWHEYMDVASFIDYLIVYEVTRNTELEWPKSTYLHKKAGGKWTWGPIWDFDWAYGYTGWQNYWSSASSQLYGGYDDGRPGSTFFNKLFQSAEFKKEYKARWQQIKPLISNIDVFVEQMGDHLAASDYQNKQVWGYQYTKNYAGEIVSMQSWLRQRISYLDGVITNY
ncbi:MAG: CotH kinase family protein [Rikenellaceae bacterium]|jgi:hypothetical protein|nr:CotH kinase family protein [Rikenellaceae bacterium]